METQSIQQVPARRGVGMGAAIGIIAAIIIVGGIAFYISDPFNTWTKGKYKELTEWTPQNIADNPVAYLDFVEDKTKQAVQELKGDRVAVEMKRGEFNQMKETAANKVRQGEALLAKLKDTYEQTSGSPTATVVWEGQNRDVNWLKTQIMTIYKQTETQKNVLSRVEGGLKTLDAQVVKIDKAQGEATAQLAEIAANRELLKVQQLTQGLQDRLVAMKGAVQGVMAVAGESADSLSLDRLATESSASVDEAEFEKIMGKK